MDQFVNNSGFHLIAEMVFLQLEFHDLINCLSVSKSWYSFLNQPRFWIKKCSLQNIPNEEVIWKSFLKDFRKIPRLSPYLTQDLMKLCYRPKLEKSLFHFSLEFRVLSMMKFLMKNLKTPNVEEKIHQNLTKIPYDLMIEATKELEEFQKVSSDLDLPECVTSLKSLCDKKKDLDDQRLTASYVKNLIYMLF